jgi:putative FmdB family regulatory protein
MPIYEYECQACGHQLEALQKVSERPLKKCPECGKPKLIKLMSAPSFRLKGGGWYETDFKSGNQRNLADSGKEDKPATKDKDDKPAATDKADKPVKEAKESTAKPDKAADKPSDKSSDKPSDKKAKTETKPGKRPSKSADA